MTTTPNPDNRAEFDAVVSGLDGAAIERAAYGAQVGPHPSGGVAHRPVRDLWHRWLARRANPADNDEGDGTITTGAFTAVAAVTVLVAGLAFALSFTMMLTAARHYGWPRELAPLFPLLIDVGAIGGTFMGAISGNRTYRRIGHQVLAVTLSASVVFNLAGHSIVGTLPGLPTGWAWTGTAAAILVPGLLAYFVHAFSKALRTYTEQRRTQRAAEVTEAEAAAEAAAEAERERQVERETERGRAADTQPAANPLPQPKPARARKPKAPGLDPDIAIRWSRSNGHPGPAAVRRHFTQQGYQVPSIPTLRRWINNEKEQ